VTNQAQHTSLYDYYRCAFLQNARDPTEEDFIKSVLASGHGDDLS
jgi:hypothetical protein